MNQLTDKSGSVLYIFIETLRYLNTVENGFVQTERRVLIAESREIQSCKLLQIRVVGGHFFQQLEALRWLPRTILT